MSGATVILSMEIELEWGFRDLGTPSHVSGGATAERKTLQKLLSLCEKIDLPFSFDIVGHLFQESCPGYHDGPHETGWFASDPGSNRETAPGYYAPDIVDAIDQSEQPHEICTHTYSHVLCDEVDDATFDWELEHACEQFDAFGLDPPRSLVPPRHHQPPMDRLCAHGIDVVRLPFPDFEQPDYDPVRKLWWLLTRSIPCGDCQLVDGTVVTYCSPFPSLSAIYLRNGRTPPHPVYRTIPLRIRQWLHRRQLRQAIEEAIERNSTLHLWTHLQNISNDQQWPQVEWVLREIARREPEKIEVRPMRSLGHEFRGDPPAPHRTGVE